MPSPSSIRIYPRGYPAENVSAVGLSLHPLVDRILERCEWICPVALSSALPTVNDHIYTMKAET